MHQKSRVQNEVGILTLASAAFHHIKPTVVPRVFGWGGTSAAPEHMGWILEESMPGVPLVEAFRSMSLEQKKGILAQMVALLKGLQSYELPESIRGWGGVTFDDNGAIVSAAMTTVGAGPWSSFEDSFRARLKIALAKADKSPHLQGWRPNGVRKRVDAFIEQGLAAQFDGFTSKHDRAIIHADFTTDNLLYDPVTGHITALLDYDFASIMHPAYEFFRSFSGNGGQLTGWLGDTTIQEKESAAIRNAKLSGQFPSPLPAPVPSENGPGLDWELAQAWEDELQKLDAKRPSTMQGVDRVANVDEILGALVPWRLANEDFLRMNADEDTIMALRRIGERQLVSLLDHVGF
ncbi:uncharacterized protein BCR38DRAFT_107309 [Pseudomassariella vexata]|uniref:Aminoglycoside phosphotransferase domain-containing protein n=1 Tax=Pseudomassariella vexata TaxID=1141098 RepID=A0A1Y2EFW3_9PEZI|nr:uncharacterized protein BCR38DRAFT_107309 [Pseudomassariella vexata]ORY70468.1 hypothetical protein BCR38DRAFT_107309 [Pseudomassariella vexata]